MKSQEIILVYPHPPIAWQSQSFKSKRRKKPTKSNTTKWFRQNQSIPMERKLQSSGPRKNKDKEKQKKEVLKSSTKQRKIRWLSFQEKSSWVLITPSNPLGSRVRVSN